MDKNSEEKIELIKKSFEYKNQKRYKEAIETLYKVLEYDNGIMDNVEILCQLGELYVSLKAYDRAIDEFTKALNLDKNNEYAKQKCFEVYYEQKNYQKALNIASEMCEINKTAQSYHNYIKTLIALDNIQDAIEIFNNLDEGIKLNTDILYLISTVSSDPKRHLLLKKIIEIDETHTLANVDMATIEFEKGNYDKVIPYCLNLVEDHPLALYYLARIEADKQNYSSAIEYYIKAISLDNDVHNFYTDLAKAYIDICWYDEAMTAIKQSINIALINDNKKDLDEKFFIAGWICIKQNKISKALTNLNAIETNSPLYRKAQILVQIVNLKESNLAKVIIELEQLYRKESTNPLLIDTLAMAYKELKMYKKAIIIYKKGLDIKPNSIYYTLELIDLYIDNKEYEEAKFLIDSFMEHSKNCPSIYNSLARIYYRMKEYEKALEALNEYLKLDINNSETYYFKGLILNDLSKFEEAKSAIYTAIRINPNIAKYYSQMARSYSGIEEYKNALLYAKEAIDINSYDITYKKQAYDIAVQLNDQKQIQNFKKQLERSEKILKLER